jgi:hypothetical protein
MSSCSAACGLTSCTIASSKAWTRRGAGVMLSMMPALLMSLKSKSCAA